MPIWNIGKDTKPPHAPCQDSRVPVFTKTTGQRSADLTFNFIRQPPNTGFDSTSAMTLLEEESLKLTEVQRLEGHTDRVWGLAWNPATGADGVPAVLASCSGDKTIRIWQQRSPSSTSFDCKV